MIAVLNLYASLGAMATRKSVKQQRTNNEALDHDVKAPPHMLHNELTCNFAHII